MAARWSVPSEAPGYRPPAVSFPSQTSANQYSASGDATDSGQPLWADLAWELTTDCSGRFVCPGQACFQCSTERFRSVPIDQTLASRSERLTQHCRVHWPTRSR